MRTSKDNRSLPSSNSEIEWLQWVSSKQPNREKLLFLIETHGISWRSQDGCGPLVLSMRQQRKKAPQFIEMLLEEGLDPNEPGGSVSALFEACYQQDLKSLRILLAAGASPNANTAASALGQACLAKDQKRFVVSLIEAGAAIYPSLRFDGLVAELDRGSNPLKPLAIDRHWGWVADAIMRRNDASLWAEFSAQLQRWALNQDDDRVAAHARVWLSEKEAADLSAKFLAPTSTKVSRRI